MGVLAWVFAIIGAVIGANARDSFVGFLVGGTAGFTFGWLIRVAERVRRLEWRVKELERRLQQQPFEVTLTEPIETAAVATPPRQPEVAATVPETVPEPAAMVTVRTEPPVSESIHWEQVTPSSGIDPIVALVRHFFTDGNVVVRVGIIVLFFGVAFLLKFAIDRHLLPIELRLAVSALGGIGLIMLGWRLRTKRTSYALLIQGGGIGIFYLTVFAAAKLYHLLPLGLALLLMVSVVALSSLLALWQNSRALAAFGIAGGFLAPVLTSTGGGNHVLLFSYYALLNGGILGIAWYRAWRELNLLGFLFTFVIGTSWGVSYYQPALFTSTEPFLILFFLFYVVIAVLFALRQPLQLRGYVDGTLVFGVPIVGFALQAGLVHNFEYGLASSAFVLGGFYITLASSLWRRAQEGMRLLTESFLALGVVFATLAIPLAVDGRWTAAAWALEGAALFWIGVHQSRLLARLTGLLLQVGAGLFFLLDLYQPTGEWPVVNGIFLGAMLITMAGLFTSLTIYRHGERLRSFEQWIEYAMLGWGLLWWLAFGVREIELHVDDIEQFNATVLFFAASGALLLSAWRLLKWNTLHYPLLGVLPIALLMAFDVFVGSQPHFFVRWGIVSWLVLFIVQYRLLWRNEQWFDERLVRFGHALTLWFLLALLGHELHWLVTSQLHVMASWQAITWVIPALLAQVVLGRQLWVPHWPVARFVTTYQIEALLPVAVALLLWGLMTLRLDANPWPLPFIPLLNPLELMQLLALMVVVSWWWSMHDEERLLAWLPDKRLTLAMFAALAFAWLNGVIAHTVHHFAAVPYTLYSLHRSVIFQTALSVTWTMAALFITVGATRLRLRTLWLAGALLLALVVVKLFFIDLAKSGTVERIVSFLVVGGLMLVIGYFSPLPPKHEEKQS